MVETNIPPKKKKKEEVGSNFKCKYSGKGKPVSFVFNDKWGLTLKQNGWGKGGKKWSKNWRQKIQRHLLQGRPGGVVEPVHVEDERVENENQDDGAGREKGMGESGGVGGYKEIELCAGHGDSGGARGGDGDDDNMQDDDNEGEVLEEEEDEEEDQQHPFQEDHVDVTNWLDLLNRSVPPPLRES